MKHYHPRKDDKDQTVELHQPSQATELANWDHPDQRASVTPDAQMPARVDGLAIASWKDTPTDAAGWERLAQTVVFDEPPLKSVIGKAPASGAVVVEPDGRVWAVSPSNRFGGYTHTFPKGKLEAKENLSLRANAVKEVFEVCGLQVELTGFLFDSVRSTSVTRYFLARRLGGNPADMGWESQAVHLVPQAQLSAFISHPNDQGVLQALKGCRCGPLTRDDILKYWTLTSGYRILMAAAGFKAKFGHWPSRMLVDAGMADAIQEDVLTPLGWALLASKLEIVKIDRGTVIAEGDGKRYEYGETDFSRSGTKSAEQWIWGVDLSY